MTIFNILEFKLNIFL